MTPQRTDTPAYAALLLLVACVHAAMSWLTPPQYDDLGFISIYRSYAGGSTDFSLEALGSFFQELRQNDNSRLANLLAPFSTLFTPWREIFPLVTGAVTALIVALAVSLCRVGAGLRFRYAVVLLAMITLLLPWRNSLFVADYSLNYVYASAVTLAYVWVMSVKWRALRKPWAFAGALLLAALAGVWHEGFAVPALAGFAVMWLDRRTRPQGWRWLAVTGVYALAAAWIVLCPGIFGRVDREVGERIGAMDWKVAVDLFPLLMLTGTALLLTTFRAGRRWMAAALADGAFTVLATASLAGAMLSLVVAHTPRTGFWPSLCAIIALVILLRRPLDALLRRRSALLLVIIMFGLWITQSILAISSQKLLCDENRRIMALLRDSPGGTVYYDIISPDSVSPATLYFPSRSTWVAGFQYLSVSQLLDIEHPAVVPTALRHIHAAVDTLSAPGAVRTVMRTGGALFTDPMPDLDYQELCTFDVTLPGQASPVTLSGLALPFVTADGDSLTYLRPYKVDPSEAEAVELVSYGRRAES